MPSASPSAFVVDDDSSVRTAVSRLLRSHGMKVQVFESASAFLEDLPDVPSGCVLLDLRMPGFGGLALQQRMIEEGVLYPIIFITGDGDVRTSVQAMKAGAVDFLQKPFDEDTLMSAVNQALILHDERMQRHVEASNVQARLQRLTPRETEVLELVAAGLRNRAVAEELGISERTVKVHRGRVMKKLDASSLPELVRLVETRDSQPASAPAFRSARFSPPLAD